VTYPAIVLGVMSVEVAPMSAQALSVGLAGRLVDGGFVWVTTGGDTGGTGTRAYDGQVLGDPDHFVVVNQRIPDPSSRSEARTRLAHWCLVRATVTGVAAQQVRNTAQQVIDALEGKRVTASGWLTSPLELLNTREPVEDRDAGKLASGRYPMFAVLEFEYTATIQEA
jgi:hypothetical protein